MEQKEAFAAAIRRLLDKRKQSDLARKSGIKESVLSDYVNAKRFPRKENFAAIARGLGCSPTQLEELMWKLRLEDDPGVSGGAPAEPADSAQSQFHELLFKRKIIDPHVVPDPKLRFMLEQVAASTYHYQVASSRFASAMSALVDYLTEDSSRASES
ncbi:MAG: helix-turn-helix domain-containing protein [Thermoanaerobaculia bacterium]|nr:helix-turn-helix domain-containing protein [Thermoanaerobaculia bacterium]